MKKTKLRDGTEAWMICDLRDLGKCEDEYPLRGAFVIGGMVSPCSWAADGRQLARTEGPLDLIIPFEFKGTGLYWDNNGNHVRIVWIHENGTAIGFWTDPDTDPGHATHTYDKYGKLGCTEVFLTRKLTAEEALNEDKG